MTNIEPINTGPCQPWTDTAAISECCTNVGTAVDLDVAAEFASDLLYQLSGGRFPGICEATVRPGSREICWWPIDPARGWNWGWSTFRSYIVLAGYPIRQIVQVQIDGAILDPSAYELWRNVRLVRVDGLRWPSRPEGGDDTFTVEYLYGLEPPLAGQAAAAELACQIAKACPGNTGGAADCKIPAGTVRYTRQGLSVDTQALGLWLIGTLRTGMQLVDAFLSVYGQQKRMRTAFASPEADPYPLRVS